MKAMILAAGLGTRLRPITNTKPKALVEIRGVPLLEIVLKHLLSLEITEVIINVHHFADQIVEFLKAKEYFGIHIEISYEEHLLDTGGGLKKAAYFFDDGQPFFVHNVDIISDIDLKMMFEWHLTHHCLATLAVNQRETKRYLIFDEDNQLCGWKSLQDSKTVMTRTPKGRIKDLAFCGIHTISPIIFDKLTETGSFSIVESYLRLAGEGEKIQAFRVDDYSWQDVGKLEQLQSLMK
jgi:NDP-sugar pyrophosphorylase family protein